MNDQSFARGARIKPKEPQRPTAPINEEIPFPQFMAMMGIYAVQDYKLRDKAEFLKWCGRAFDVAMRSVHSASTNEEKS